jgi:hypothetical protein
MRKKRKKKALALSMMLTMGLMSPLTTNAQQYYGGNFGLFGRGDNAENGNRGYNSMEITVNTQDFGQDVPLEGGIAILIGVGIGYVALKRKENEQ